MLIFLAMTVIIISRTFTYARRHIYTFKLYLFSNNSSNCIIKSLNYIVSKRFYMKYLFLEQSAMDLAILYLHFICIFFIFINKQTLILEGLAHDFLFSSTPGTYDTI